MDIKTRGIVLRTFKHKDSQYISDIYTENYGRIPFLIRVPKSSKGKIRLNNFQHFFQLDIEGIYRETREIQTIREVQLLHTYTDIPYNVHKSTISMFLCDLLAKCLYEKEENPDLFNFLISAGLILDQSEKTGNFPIVFMKELTHFLGFRPENNYSEERKIFDMERGYYTLTPPIHGHYLTGNNAEYMRLLLECSLLNMSEHHISKAQRNVLMKFMINYYKYHIENFGTLKTLEVLREVFE